MDLPLLGLAAVLLAPAPDPAEALVRRVEAQHRRAGDLVARFTQSYRSGVLGREIVESGTLSLKRPGLMRWEYLEPERKTFVSDGRSYYFYVPEDRQVVVRDQAGDKRAPALLLAGESDLLSEFEASLVRSGEPGPRRLRLTPREPDPDLREVTIEVDDADRIVGIEVLDVQGNLSRFHFFEIRENVGLDEGLFEFEVPRGVEVVNG